MKRFLIIAFFALVFPATFAFSADLSFGRISYIPGGGNAAITLDPITGAISCNNTANYFCPSFGTPGNTVVFGDAGTVIEISCLTTARISDGNTTYGITRSEVYIPGQSKSRCDGLRNKALTHTISPNTANNIIYWGGRLRIRGNTTNISGTYTTTGGGDARPQTIRIIFL